jgi:RNA polymerase sigma factor (sigma-70 family)
MNAAQTQARLARLRAALIELPPVHRAVYLLSARDGLAYSEIAGRLGLSIGEVEQRLAEALAWLSEQFDRSRDDGLPPDELDLGL